jgi:antitoxin VapB
MPLSIRNPRAEALAREAARTTGGSMTEAIIKALEEFLSRRRGPRPADDLPAELLRIGRRSASLPDLDTRSEERILGYGADGTFERPRRRGR